MIFRSLLGLCLASAAFAQDVVPGSYIVELTGDPAIVHQDRSRRRREIQSEQLTVERTLRLRRATVRARVDTVVNALIIDAPDATGLASLPGVRRVEAVRSFKPLLTRALGNHQALAAWEVIGGMEKAGAGMKIGILDSGLNTDHKGFSGEGMTAPDGFPQFSPDINQNFTNGKVIVARSFDAGAITDTTGHGTGVAMAAAGVQHESLRGVISGVAPRAWLGIYRVTTQSGVYRTDNILQALEAAVNDGMDVLNLSFGAPGATGASGKTIFEDGTRRAMDSGILVVHAAGNTPGAQTVDDAASAEKEIAVGANSSTPAPSVVPSSGRSYPAAESNNVTLLEPVSGTVVDAETLNGNLLGCTEFPPESMTFRIALIRRGDCDFAVKLTNAANAGAVAAIVFNSPNPPTGSPDDLVSMQAGANAKIPALFIGNTNGLKLQELVRTVEDFTVQLRFPYPGPPNSLASFSSQGPSINELAIKPDLVATGTSFYTAAVTGPATQCSLCDPSGYVTVQGTSFAAPLVAGAAAVIKAAHPGLTSDDYRSLLINSASPMIFANGSTSNVMAAGSGILNLKNAVTSTIAAAPVSLSFGSGDGTVDRTKEFQLKNVGAQSATWTLTIDTANDTKPALSAETITLAPGESAPVQLTFHAEGLAAGASQGFVRVEEPATGAAARIPYWYAVTGGAPATLSLIRTPNTASAFQQIDLFVRVHDAAGLPLPDVEPVVTPVLGGGLVESIQRAPASIYPNTWWITLRLGQPDINTFSIKIGDVTYTYGIIAE